MLSILSKDTAIRSIFNKENFIQQTTDFTPRKDKRSFMALKVVNKFSEMRGPKDMCDSFVLRIFWTAPKAKILKVIWTFHTC